MCHAAPLVAGPVRHASLAWPAVGPRSTMERPHFRRSTRALQRIACSLEHRNVMLATMHLACDAFGDWQLAYLPELREHEQR